MNAQPSFNPPPQSRQPRKSRRQQVTQSVVKPRHQSKLNPAHAHRRQGLEVSVKLVTYLGLSIFGIVTLVNLLGYNWSQQSKFQHLDTELKDAQARMQKSNHSLTRSFDGRSQQNVMTENSYKIAPDKLPIIITPTEISSPAKK